MNDDLRSDLWFSPYPLAIASTPWPALPSAQYRIRAVVAGAIREAVWESIPSTFPLNSAFMDWQAAFGTYGMWERPKIKYSIAWYIDGTNGSDQADGSRTAPLQTYEEAQRRSSLMPPGVQNTLHIVGAITFGGGKKAKKR